MQQSISIPNEWAPRDYQRAFFNAVARGTYNRFCVVAHRRWGKDSCCINGMAVRAVTEPGLYYYMAPSQKHARKIIWDNIGRDGKRIINQAFPEEVRKNCNDQEMRLVVESAGGKESIFQIVGSDNYDSIVGTNPRGIIFSEWALAAKPEAWDYFRPILAENDGWAAFISTPRSLNHFYFLHRMAQTNDKWFSLLHSVEHTSVLTPDDVEAEREAGMSDLLIRQEFYCEFLAATEAQVFDGQILNDAMYERELPNPVDTHAPTVVGVDVARFGSDRTVIATRMGRDFRSVHPIIMQQQDLVRTAQRIAEHARHYQPDAIVIDATGLGAGVADILRRQYRIPVRALHFSEKATNDTQFHSIRTEMYFKFKEWLEDPAACLPAYDPLREEMASIEFDYDTDGRFRLEAKQAAKKRLGMSPDLADAYALTFAVQVPRKDAWQFRNQSREPQQAVISW